jgi:hypothetical protein
VIQVRTTVATPPVIVALLDQAREKDYKSGVLGVRAQPRWDGPARFGHQDVPVRVMPCVSALAVREALLARERGTWLVVLTDRDDSDLGAGVLSHLVWHRLRTPDPWDAVRQRFAASGIDPALTTAPNHREIAVGLLSATRPTGWPPAPGGVLTRDHALGAVARMHLGLGGDADAVDAATVLQWSTDRATLDRIADLRVHAGDPLTDATLEWIGQRSAAAGGPLRQLLVSGEVGDALPLGLVAGLLVKARGGAEAQIAHDALIRLEARLGSVARDRRALEIWGRDAEDVAVDLLEHREQRAVGERVVVRAEALLHGLQADPLAAGSDLLPAGITARLGRLAAALRDGADQARARAARSADHPLMWAEELTAIEDTWSAVSTHRLADTDRRRPAFEAAVRLARWLGQDTVTGPELADLVRRHLEQDAWIDSAVNAATAGVGEPELGSALHAVLAVARHRRDAHDHEFARALAEHTRDDPAPEPVTWGRRYRGVRHVEDLLPDIVARLAATAPVLVLVMDGMTVGVAAVVVGELLERTADGWAEALLPGEESRCAALAVLPTLTAVSRTSLLSGDLSVGEQPEERKGYTELARAHGLAGAALFHKGPLDTSRPGHDFADEVAAAIDNVDRTPLVTCVLNAVDDSLDRSDPAGTRWGMETVRHLAPLLERARRAGRVVVVTADHGHIVERRDGEQRTYAGISSARSRPADGPPPGAGEVLVAGRRVLRHNGRAVLAVDERLRYGPLKAGYHGGAAPAEVVVPVCVLLPGVVPEGAPLRLAPPQEPPWWTEPDHISGSGQTDAAREARATATRPVRKQRITAEQDALFGDQQRPTPSEPLDGPHAIADAVVGSAVYAAQRRIVGRVAVSDESVRTLLAELLAASNRLPAKRAAAALQVTPVALRGAFAHVARLVNVEGYPVVRIDADGTTVVLDAALLREQFEVASGSG